MTEETKGISAETRKCEEQQNSVRGWILMFGL